MITMIVKNKFSLRGNSEVTDAAGKPLFEVKGTFTMWRRKKIYDLDGKLLYTVRNKMLRLPLMMNSAYIFDADGKKLGRLKQSVKLGAEYRLLGGEEECVVTSTLTSGGASLSITRGGTVIAQGNRSTGMTEHGDSFTVTVGEENAPFALALIVATDNINDKNRK